MNLERRYSGWFNVYNSDGDLIEEVHWQPATVDEVRRSLIDHDGFPSDIVVKPAGKPLGLSDAEMEALCEYYDVTVEQNGEGWIWSSPEDNSNGEALTDKRSAMEEAINCLDLETRWEDENA